MCLSLFTANPLNPVALLQSSICNQIINIYLLPFTMASILISVRHDSRPNGDHLHPLKCMRMPFSCRNCHEGSGTSILEREAQYWGDNMWRFCVWIFFSVGFLFSFSLWKVQKRFKRKSLLVFNIHTYWIHDTNTSILRSNPIQRGKQGGSTFQWYRTWSSLGNRAWNKEGEISEDTLSCWRL